jgi:hypothetical protein
MNLLKLISAFLVVVVSSLSAGYPCVGCRAPGDSIGDDPTLMIQAGLGFSWSVLFLLAVVLSLAGGLVVFVARTVRDLDRRNSSNLRP